MGKDICDFSASVGDNDDFWDVEEEQLIQNQQKEKGKTFSDKEVNTDPIHMKSYETKNSENESDSFGDDELYSEPDTETNSSDFIDLQEFCDEVREDIKYCYRYVKGGISTFYGRLKHEWSDWLYGDTFEHDYVGVGVGIDGVGEDDDNPQSDIEEM